MSEEKANKNVFERPVREFKPKAADGKTKVKNEEKSIEISERKEKKGTSEDKSKSIRDQILYPEMSVTGTGKNVRLPNGIYALAQRMAKEDESPVYQLVSEIVRDQFLSLPEEKQNEILDTIQSGVELGFIKL